MLLATPAVAGLKASAAAAGARAGHAARAPGKARLPPPLRCYATKLPPAAAGQGCCQGEGYKALAACKRYAPYEAARACMQGQRFAAALQAALPPLRYAAGYATLLRLRAGWHTRCWRPCRCKGRQPACCYSRPPLARYALRRPLPPGCCWKAALAPVALAGQLRAASRCCQPPAASWPAPKAFL